MKNMLVLALFCAFGFTAKAQMKPLTSTPNQLFIAPTLASKWVQDNGNNEAIKKIAKQPQCIWLTSGNISALASALTAASKNDEVVGVVLYNISGRDLGQYSAGGASGKVVYLDWVQKIATNIGNRHTIVILEPDAIGQGFALDETKRNERFGMLAQATTILKALPKCEVYIEVSQWLSDDKAIAGLKACGITKADGFSLNASGFDAQQEVIARGINWSKLVGNKPFVIDTSRNGNGAWKAPSTEKEAWCNPPGRAIGVLPTLNTGNPLIRAFLWIKHPGESDGACRGGPPAGEFWPEYAAKLVE